MKVRDMIECHLRAGICMAIGLIATVLCFVWFWSVRSAISEVVLSVSVIVMVYYGGQLVGTRVMFKELVDWDLVNLEKMEEDIEAVKVEDEDDLVDDPDPEEENH